MNKKLLFLSALSLFGFGNANAQIDVEEEGNDIIVSFDNGDVEDIVFPEAMNADPDSLMHLFTARKYLEADGDCQTTGENPTFPTEVYVDRLRRMPTIMEMAHNDIVQQFINRYTGPLRRSVSVMLGASNFYMPIFEDALEAYQLPLELKYLPVIESALKPTAVSHVGATGLWQFMLSTGKKYGLTVNNYVDERRDPQKSSYAAAHLLSDLYKIFGDWNLVIAAYNCGPGNVNKAIHRANGERDFWKIYPYLPKETRGYVPAFIAANYAMTYYCEHNICPMRTTLPPSADTVMVNRNVDLRQIAAVLDLDIDMVRALNPMYRRDLVPGQSGPLPICLLPNDAVRFIDMQDSICNYNAKQYMTKRDVVPVDDVPAVKKTTTARRTRARKAPTRTSRTKKKAVTRRKRNGRR